MTTNDIDINSLELDAEVIETGAGVSDDEFFKPPIPDDGLHTVTVALGADGLSVDRQRDKSTGDKTGPLYLKAHLALTLVDDAGNRTGTAFDRINSIPISGGKSRLQAILGLCGAATGAASTLGALKTLAEETFAQSPRISVVTAWEASAKAETQEEVTQALAAHYAKKLDIGGYYTFLRGQKKFPLNEATGKHERTVVNPITGADADAQVRVVRYERAK